MRMAALALLLTGCGNVLPQVTPTVAPTQTPIPMETLVSILPTATPILRPSSTPTDQPASATPSATASATSTHTPSATPTPEPSITPSATFTPTLTFTPTATDTATATFTPSPTFTPSLTPFISPTPSSTFTPTATDTPTLTPTATDTATPTFTPIPTDTATPTFTPIPTDTATATPEPSLTPSSTFTPPPTVTPSATFTPSLTFTPTIDGTRIVELLLTRQALITPTPPTWTPVPLPSDTPTLPPATLDATPTFVTPTPVEDFGVVLDTPIPPTATPLLPTLAPSPTAPPVVQPTPLPPPIFSYNPPSLQALRFTIGPGGFRYNGQAIGGDVRLFAPNPAFPASYARTDSVGMLYFAPPGGGEGAMSFSPFFEGFAVGSAAENKNFVRAIAWSPHGYHLAFLIDPPPGTDSVNAGVWFWQPAIETSNDPTYAIARDCPSPGGPSCQLSDGHSADAWRAVDFEWNADSVRLLINYELVGQGRRGASVRFAVRNAEYANRAPGIARYDWATWWDSNTLLVSGRNPEWRVIVGLVSVLGDGTIDLPSERVLYDASANGMWIQSAVRRRDGAIVALGRPGGPDGPLSLYLIANGQASPLSGPVGFAYPDRVSWTRDRASAVLEMGGAQFAVSAFTGGIQPIDPSRSP
ncbi:MAG: hypothetical protein NZ750_07315 [Anaerolineae bacterium]|nr:hypothetical protein [Anaerolineae bacterium]MDW8172156.1 hypothetical protein [Anaerolineae bacterium]